MSNGYRRKKFFFRESSQGKYIFSFFLIAGLITFLFTALFIFLSSDTISITYDNYTIQLGKTPDIILDRLLIINGILIFTGGFAIIFFVTRLTHKTIGPLFKINATIERMINGHINTEIHLRKNDDCKELAEKLNHFNHMLHSRLKEIESIIDELELHLENKISKANTDEDEKKLIEADRISVLNGKLKVVLSHFNLADNHISE